MDKRLVGPVLLVVIVALFVSAIVFQWRYDQYADESDYGRRRVVMTRTNRFTGIVQQYTPRQGWVTQQPAEPRPVMVGTPERPCPTPDPNDPFWHYGRPSCVNQPVIATADQVQ